jgi:bifunctional non-homologous end joining protein LigD
VCCPLPASCQSIDDATIGGAIPPANLNCPPLGLRTSNERGQHDRMPVVPRTLPLASRYHPQLATLVKEAPTGDDWLHDLKVDGYRIGAAIESGTIALVSRRDNDWTAQFPEIVSAVRGLRLRDTLLDGEVCAVLPDGRTSFHALQYFRAGHAHLVYFVFDALWLRGVDLRALPCEERKARVQKAIAGKHDRVVYVDHVLGDGPTVLAHACKVRAEGIISKLRTAPYEERRSRAWLKVKCVARQEFVIGGFLDPTNEADRAGVGSLLIGVYDGGRLVFAGGVGTGWTREESRALRTKLSKLETQTMPFDVPPDRPTQRRAHWVKPALVAEVAFTEWSPDGRIRHPSFQGLRKDKAPTDVRREDARVDAS